MGSFFKETFLGRRLTPSDKSPINGVKISNNQNEKNTKIRKKLTFAKSYKIGSDSLAFDEQAIVLFSN